MSTGYQAALDSNDLVMGYGKETVWGTKPAIGFQDIRLDSEGFSSTKSRTRPSEINAAGQASAAITTKRESTGSLNFSVSAGTHNDLIAAAMGGVFSAPVMSASTITFGTGTILDSGSGFVTAGFKVGMAIKITCNGDQESTWHGQSYKITTAAAGTLTCSPIGAAPTLTTATLSNVGYCNIQVISLFQDIATIAATGTGFTDSGSGFVNAGLVKGQMIKVTGFAGATINTFYRVDSVAAGTITTTPAPATTEVAGASVTIKGSMVRNGLNFDSFFFQKQMGTNLFLQYAGAFPTGGSLDVGVGDYLKGTLSFLNKAETKATVEGSTGNHIAAPTGVVVDSINGIGTVKWKNTAIAAAVQKIGLKFNKEGAANQYAIGSSAAAGVRKGTFTVSGSLSTYFKDFTLYDDFIAESAGPLGFPATDISGAGYYITICQGTIMNPKVVAGGPAQDVMADFEIEGNPDTSGYYGGKTMQIDYFG